MYIFNRIFNNLINKICWLLLILIVALVMFFVGLTRTDAAYYNSWIGSITRPINVVYFNGDGSRIQPTNTIIDGTYSYNNFSYFVSNVTGKPRIGHITTSNLIVGVNYNIEFYFCYGSGGLTTPSVNDLIGNTDLSSSNYLNVYGASFRYISNTIISNSSATGSSSNLVIGGANQCAVYSFQFRPTQEVSHLIYNVNSSSYSNAALWYFGYNLNSYSSDSELVEQQQQTNEKLDELNKTQKETHDYLTDDTAPESDMSSLGNVQGLLPPGPVDSLLNIPFMFLSVIVSSFGSNCVPITGNWVFNTTLTIPCFGDMFYSNVPSALMIFIDLVPAIFILILYFKHLYKKVDRAVSMETTSDDEWGVI